MTTPKAAPTARASRWSPMNAETSAPTPVIASPNAAVENAAQGSAPRGIASEHSAARIVAPMKMARRPARSDQRPSRIPPKMLVIPSSENTVDAWLDENPASSSSAATT
ncbi:MAG: hypothetical protein M5U14_09150 [Acidimicrobiia bacterium]|nr:hypothetical protein [Acidimicrobiia bacterium]